MQNQIIIIVQHAYFGLHYNVLRIGFFVDLFLAELVPKLWFTM